QIGNLDTDDAQCHGERENAIAQADEPAQLAGALFSFFSRNLDLFGAGSLLGTIDHGVCLGIGRNLAQGSVCQMRALLRDRRIPVAVLSDGNSAKCWSTRGSS